MQTKTRASVVLQVYTLFLEKVRLYFESSEVAYRFRQVHGLILRPVPVLVEKTQEDYCLLDGAQVDVIHELVPVYFVVKNDGESGSGKWKKTYFKTKAIADKHQQREDVKEEARPVFVELSTEGKYFLNGSPIEVVET